MDNAKKYIAYTDLNKVKQVVKLPSDTTTTFFIIKTVAKTKDKKVTSALLSLLTNTQKTHLCENYPYFVEVQDIKFNDFVDFVNKVTERVINKLAIHFSEHKV